MVDSYPAQKIQYKKRSAILALGVALSFLFFLRACHTPPDDDTKSPGKRKKDFASTSLSTGEGVNYSKADVRRKEIRIPPREGNKVSQEIVPGAFKRFSPPLTRLSFNGASESPANTLPAESGSSGGFGGGSSFAHKRARTPFSKSNIPNTLPRQNSTRSVSNNGSALQDSNPTSASANFIPSDPPLTSVNSNSTPITLSSTGPALTQTNLGSNTTHQANLGPGPTNILLAASDFIPGQGSSRNPPSQQRRGPSTASFHSVPQPQQGAISDTTGTSSALPNPRGGFPNPFSSARPSDPASTAPTSPQPNTASFHPVSPSQAHHGTMRDPMEAPSALQNPWGRFLNPFSNARPSDPVIIDPTSPTREPNTASSHPVTQPQQGATSDPTGAPSALQNPWGGIPNPLSLTTPSNPISTDPTSPTQGPNTASFHPVSPPQAHHGTMRDPMEAPSALQNPWGGFPNPFSSARPSDPASTAPTSPQPNTASFHPVSPPQAHHGTMRDPMEAPSALQNPRGGIPNPFSNARRSDPVIIDPTSPTREPNTASFHPVPQPQQGAISDPTGAPSALQNPRGGIPNPFSNARRSDPASTGPNSSQPNTASFHPVSPPQAHHGTMSDPNDLSTILPPFRLELHDLLASLPLPLQEFISSEPNSGWRVRPLPNGQHGTLVENFPQDPLLPFSQIQIIRLDLEKGPSSAIHTNVPTQGHRGKLTEDTSPPTPYLILNPGSFPSAFLMIDRRAGNDQVYTLHFNPERATQHKFTSARGQGVSTEGTIPNSPLKTFPGLAKALKNLLSIPRSSSLLLLPSGFSASIEKENVFATSATLVSPSPMESLRQSAVNVCRALMKLCNLSKEKQAPQDFEGAMKTVRKSWRSFETLQATASLEDQPNAKFWGSFKRVKPLASKIAKLDFTSPDSVGAARRLLAKEEQSNIDLLRQLAREKTQGANEKIQRGGGTLRKPLPKTSQNVGTMASFRTKKAAFERKKRLSGLFSKTTADVPEDLCIAPEDSSNLLENLVNRGGVEASGKKQSTDPLADNSSKQKYNSYSEKSKPKNRKRLKFGSLRVVSPKSLDDLNDKPTEVR